MGWELFKNKYKDAKLYDESQFILGVDIGASHSSVAFYNCITMDAEIIDMSGGYGKASIPSVIQYVPETNEWTFGEYALLNRGLFNDVTITDLIDRLGKNEYFNINNKIINFVSVLGKFIKELLGSCKSINPNGEIVGIVCSVSFYFDDTAKYELKKAFIEAGFDTQFISFVADKECALFNYIYRDIIKLNLQKDNAIFINSNTNTKKIFETENNIVILDFGAKSLRGGIYNLNEDINKIISVETISYYEDNTIGLDSIDNMIDNFCTEIYLNEKNMKINQLSEQEIIDLESFLYRNKSIILKKDGTTPFKLYYNFSYPPFAIDVKERIKNNMVIPVSERILHFLSILKKEAVIGSYQQKLLDIKTVLCIGGGFEIDWVKLLIKNSFNCDTIFYKNPKKIISEGAALLAAKKLGLIENIEFNFIDKITNQNDYGVKIVSTSINKYEYVSNSGNVYTEKFYPIIERGSFWWESNRNILFTLMEEINLNMENEGTPHTVTFYKRDKNNIENVLCEIELNGLPKRPKGATRLSISINFLNRNELCCSVSDFGFGEIFPKYNYNSEKIIAIT